MVQHELRRVQQRPDEILDLHPLGLFPEVRKRDLSLVVGRLAREKTQIDLLDRLGSRFRDESLEPRAFRREFALESVGIHEMQRLHDAASGLAFAGRRRARIGTSEGIEEITREEVIPLLHGPCIGGESGEFLGLARDLRNRVEEHFAGETAAVAARKVPLIGHVTSAVFSSPTAPLTKLNSVQSTLKV